MKTLDKLAERVSYFTKTGLTGTHEFDYIEMEIDMQDEVEPQELRDELLKQGWAIEEGEDGDRKQTWRHKKAIFLHDLLYENRYELEDLTRDQVIEIMDEALKG